MEKCHSQDMVNMAMCIHDLHGLQSMLCKMGQQQITLLRFLTARINDQAFSGSIRYNIGIFPEWIEF
jgi:hypothetical protein